MKRENKRIMEALLGRHGLLLCKSKKQNETYFSGVFKRYSVDGIQYCVEDRSGNVHYFNLVDIKEITIKLDRDMSHIVISLI